MVSSQDDASQASILSQSASRLNLISSHILPLLGLSPPKMTTRTATLRKTLQSLHPWTTSPLVVCAPMRVLSGPQLTTTVASHSGIGFLGPTAKPDDILDDLSTAKSLLSKSPVFTQSLSLEKLPYLPIGVGFQTWNGDLNSAKKAVQTFKPRDVWLFAPRHGQKELDEWTVALREAFPQTLVWIQVGTLKEAIAAAESQTPPDVLVIQGAEAGGHGRAKDGMGNISLFPEVFDALSTTKGKHIPLVMAGSIVDGRGVVAALSLGASGVAMGTRFLATPEARIAKGYQQAIVDGKDAAQNTVRTQLYNHLRGTLGWPEEFSPRGLANKSWNEHEQGVKFEELKERHDDAVKNKGDGAWGKEEGRTATYAGAGVGLIGSVEPAGDIITRVRKEVKEIVEQIRSIE